MPDQPPKVTCVGIAVMDHVFSVAEMPDRPSKTFATGFAEVGGGPAANAAVTVARLGGRAALWARVGDDPVGRRICDELAGHGVAVDQVRTIPGARSGLSAVLLDAIGERMIVNYADPELDTDPSWLPLADLSGSRAVLADMRWPGAATRVLTAARRHGLPGVLDADRVPEGTDRSAYRVASHIVFSQPGLAQAAGDGDLEHGLRVMAAETGTWVGVTAGGDGVLWLDNHVLRHQPAFPVDPVDTLGAGDVFHGAFALALAEGRDAGQACRFAAAAAAVKCGRHGTRAGYPTRGDLETLIGEAVS